jgi:hypothetical protein
MKVGRPDRAFSGRLLIFAINKSIYFEIAAGTSVRADQNYRVRFATQT